MDSGAIHTTEMSATAIDATMERVVTRDNTPAASATQRTIRVKVVR